MKIIKILTAAALLGTASINFTSCKGDKDKEVNPVEDSLKNVTHQLGGQLNEKEAALQEFIGAFNEIQENLNEIKAKEKIVTTASSTGDVKSKERQIK
ncbi:MAG: hypothetical protein H0W61_17285, partial [Bacteroidetes bacterium]|nr:hypothetical protein [Bacteroidota bacterium]